jgi:hypothetical protein
MANSKPIGVAYSDQDIIGADTVLVNSVLGYTTSGEGSVTQATSKATAVTLNTSAGTITMNNAALAAATEVAFIVTNSAVSAYDVPIVALASGATTAGTYLLSVAAVAAGSCTVVISHASAGSLSEALTLNFALIHVAQA